MFLTLAFFNRAHAKHVFISCSDFLYSSPFRTAVSFLLFYSVIFRHCSSSSCLPFMLRSISSSRLHDRRWSFPAPALCSELTCSSSAHYYLIFSHYFFCCSVCLPSSSIALWAEVLLFSSLFLSSHTFYELDVSCCIILSSSLAALWAHVFHSIILSSSWTGLWAHLFISCSIILWSSHNVLLAHMFLTCSGIPRCYRHLLLSCFFSSCSSILLSFCTAPGADVLVSCPVLLSPQCPMSRRSFSAPLYPHFHILT